MVRPRRVGGNILASNTATLSLRRFGPRTLFLASLRHPFVRTRRSRHDLHSQHKPTHVQTMIGTDDGDLIWQDQKASLKPQDIVRGDGSNKAEELLAVPSGKSPIVLYVD